MDRFVIKKRKCNSPSTSRSSPAEVSVAKKTNESKKKNQPEDENEQTKKSRSFRNQWLNDYKWLENKNGNAFCKVCQKEMSNLKYNLDRHENLEYHKKQYQFRKNQIKLDEMQSKDEKLLKTKVEQAERTLVMFCVMHHLPFLLMDFLPELLRKCCPDSKIAQHISCARTKAVKVLREDLSVKARNEITDLLRTEKFSLITDESTDVSCLKALVLIARVFEKRKGAVVDVFFGLLKLHECTAQAIYEAIKIHFENLNIPLKILIGLATDGANVMAGELNGLQAKFKQDNRNLFFSKCICHSLHLCASYASNKLPNEIEKTAKRICNFFAHSPKRNSDFEFFQEFADIKKHKILSLASTRWLSFEAVVNRILEQWDALKLYFISCYLEDQNKEAKNLAETLDEPSSKIYFFFLSYILKIINVMNLEFQSKDLRIHMLYNILESNTKLIISNFMDIAKDFQISQLNFSNGLNFKPLNGIFIGVTAKEFIEEKSIHIDKIRVVEAHIKDFYIELVAQIRKRFDFENEVIKNLRVISPKEICKQNSFKDLTFLVERFPNLHETGKKEDILSEYKLLGFSSLAIEQLDQNNIEKFWMDVFKLRNACEEPIFENIANFIMNLMTFPQSSAAAERKFSDLQLIKTKKSNRFDLDTVQAIMFAKELCASHDKEKVWTAN